MFSEQQTPNAVSKIVALLGHNIENSFHIGTNPQDLLFPDFGTFRGKKSSHMFIFKEAITIFDHGT